ncbi:MAG: hypothetical protein IT495_18330 [Gammaproteobacteria bacterium]|nr:hypothetical protein [Gammaproteobacteria bacterium]
MKVSNRFEDPRRAFLLHALATGLFMVAGPAAHGQALGRLPGTLLPGRSFYAVDGEVTVNGAAATLDTLVHAGDRVETGIRSRAVFAVGQDAFLLRADSHLQLAPAADEGALVETLRLVTGRLLSVFGKRRHTLSTTVATIGIRGTGVYVEADPEQSYVCTCYGTTDIAAADDPSAGETIVSTHHDAPRYVLAAGGGARLRPAPFRDHTDEELALIEALVGRTPPFAVPGDGYGRPRRELY